MLNFQFELNECCYVLRLHKYFSATYTILGIYDLKGVNGKLLEQNKKKLLAFLKDPLYVPMKQKEIAILLGVGPERRQELVDALEALLKEGRIEVSKRGKYQITQDVKLVGTFTGHAKGFGFVTVEGKAEDYFIPATYVNGAMHHDLVEIVLLPKKGGMRTEAKIVKIIEHGKHQVVGLYEKMKSFGFVKPDNQKVGQDIYIPSGSDLGAVSGHKVVVELTTFGEKNKKPEGKIVEIIGHKNEPGTDILSIAKDFGIENVFPQEVLEEIRNVPDEVTLKAMEGRKDLRSLMMVTIDGEDAKDLDDAVSLTKLEKGYELGVHIADVSHYVKEGSPLDTEALKRGTSVYLVDRVLPMLPQKLSNGICSLNAGEDRLALSCLMRLDDDGNVIDHLICESVIKVNRRMSYTQVNAILEHGDKTLCEEFKEFVPMLTDMRKVAAALRQKRKKRGSIDFEFPETKIILNEKGKPIQIKPYERNVATNLIEEFMLAANETVAEDYYWQEIPFLYRTHDNPDGEKMQKLATFIHNFGHIMKGAKDDIHPKEIQKLLVSIEGTPEEALISRLTLRSMKQAKYTPENTGHFGLAAKYYCHFTSPIRRYPDLQIHRIIKESLHGDLKEGRIAHYENLLGNVGNSCSKLERRADEAERETEKLKKVEYMSQHWGEVFSGVVSGVTQWGIYVELDNTIEGLVHVSNLKGDYFNFIEERYEMVGERTGKTYKLGQTVYVTLRDLDKRNRTIDFDLVTGGEM